MGTGANLESYQTALEVLAWLLSAEDTWPAWGKISNDVREGKTISYS